MFRLHPVCRLHRVPWKRKPTTKTTAAVLTKERLRSGSSTQPMLCASVGVVNLTTLVHVRTNLGDENKLLGNIAFNTRSYSTPGNGSRDNNDENNDSNNNNNNNSNNSTRTMDSTSSLSKDNVRSIRDILQQFQSQEVVVGPTALFPSREKLPFMTESVEIQTALPPTRLVTTRGWIKSVRKHRHLAFIDLNDGSCLDNLQLVVEAQHALLAQCTVGSCVQVQGNVVGIEVAGVKKAVGAMALAADAQDFNDAKKAQKLDDAEESHASLSFSFTKMEEANKKEGQCHGIPRNGTTSLQKKKRVEMHPKHMEIVGLCPADEYPFQKKYQSLEFLRENLHLRPRTNTIGAVTRIRNALSHGIHQFFQNKDFIQVHTPILTSIDAEGAGEQFRISTHADPLEIKKTKTTKEVQHEFFDRPTFLTVSGQLHAEIYACSMSKVYTFGPTFRAENSNTSRHLAEFWMIEAEVAGADLQENMSLAEATIKYAIQQVLHRCEDDVAFFAQQKSDPLIMSRLTNTLQHEFAQMTYTKAVEVLRRSGRGFDHAVKWGLDLQSEHERYLSEEYVKGPLFLTDYPAAIKPFYMRGNDSDGGRTVANMDLLVPKIGELIGGSVREERYEVLKSNMQRMQDDKAAESVGRLKHCYDEDLNWYLDLRKFGTVPHAGWGLGFERLVLYATGVQNIRDAIPIPRYPQSCSM